MLWKRALRRLGVSFGTNGELALLEEICLEYMEYHLKFLKVIYEIISGSSNFLFQHKRHLNFYSLSSSEMHFFPFVRYLHLISVFCCLIWLLLFD